MGHGTCRAWAAGLLGVMVLVGGCATNKDGPVQEITEPGPVPSMQDMRQELLRAQAQVDDVLADMEQLHAVSAADLPGAYEAFTRQVWQTALQADAAAYRAGRMQEQREQYVASWEKEIGQLSTLESRAGAPERRQVVRQNYTRLQEAARATAAAYPPLLAQLRDIQKDLSVDLTPVGVKAARPAFESARNMAIKLKLQMANFVAQIDLVLAVSPPKK